MKNRDVVRTFLESFKAGNVEAALAMLHPQAVMEEADSLPYSGRFVGREGYLSIAEKMHQCLNVAIESVDLIDADPLVMARMSLTLIARATGKKLSMKVVELYTVQDEKITHIDIYYKDTKAVSDLVFGQN